MLYTFGGLTIILSLVILSLLVLVFHPDTQRMTGYDAGPQTISLDPLRRGWILCIRVANQLRGQLWRAKRK